MLLGTLLKGLQSSDHAADLLVATGDITLMARVEETGAAFDEMPGDYAANAASRFSRQASDEDWLALMTALEKAEHPAQACLGKILDWALREDAAKPKAFSSEVETSGRLQSIRLSSREENALKQKEKVPQQPCTCGHAAGACHGSS